MGRKQAREGAMKLLFQMDSNDDFSESEMELFIENFTFDKNEEKYIDESITKVRENIKEIDHHIESNLESWSIHRLAKVDLAVLRISIYEILYRDDIPVEVSINEAIEIVKKYSSSDSFKFINGVLGGFVKSLDSNNKVKTPYIEEDEDIGSDIGTEADIETNTDTDIEEDIISRIETELDSESDIKE